MAAAASSAGRAPMEELEMDKAIRAEEDGANARRAKFTSGLRRRILHFTPSWFVVNMGTGISSILLYNLPYSFKGLEEIGIAIWLLNVVLFSLFLLMSIARYCIFPTVFYAMLFHPVQSLFLGCFPMGFATIVNMTVFVAAERWRGRWIWLAWSLWWIDAVISVIIAVGVPFFVFTRHQHVSTLDTISPAWLLPIVAPNVASATGGIVAAVLPPSQARLTIIVSYMLWSSVPVAVMIMGLLYLRMAVHKVRHRLLFGYGLIPLAAEIFSVLLPLGACGQGAFAILQLAEVGLEHAQVNGTWLDGGRMLGSLPAGTAEFVAGSVSAGTICIALVIWALGAFWLLIALLSIIDTAFEGRIPFNMGWWGLTFPIGTHAVAAATLGRQLGSAAFKVVGTVESVAVVLLWIYIAGMTIVKSIEGSIFSAPCLGPTGQPPTEAPRKKRPLGA
ncbi:hypothetical protein Rt10032_c09g4066 [Rhodotorula toruloides]|uniref:Sulfite efflux pump SSU1 n=1 Tax=Rhodotorula toruloides TaxID=5286 RepID=A0A511KI39_RHOTO|nr:hypothetical protein Rt10032_c09g4066 [Rhodotorula toruloides]